MSILNKRIYFKSESEDRTTQKKNCYACKCEIILNSVKIANPFMDVEHLKKLYGNPYIEFYCCD